MASQRPPLPRRRINGAHPHHAPRSTRQGGEPTPTTRRRLNPDGIAERFTYLHQTAGRDRTTGDPVNAKMPLGIGVWTPGSKIACVVRCLTLRCMTSPRLMPPTRNDSGRLGRQILTIAAQTPGDGGPSSRRPVCGVVVAAYGFREGEVIRSPSTLCLK